MTTATMPDYVQAYAWARPNVRIEHHDKTKGCMCPWFMYGPEKYGIGPVPDPESPEYLADVLNGLEKQCCHLHIMHRNDLGRGFEWEVSIDSHRDIVMGVGYGTTWKAALIAAVLEAKEPQK